jgi:tyrosyl-tRNA synthetase
MGTDGQKMSKSQGNAIWINDTPTEMYGKIMSMADSQIVPYFTLATTLSQSEVDEKIKEQNPMKLKHDLAYQIVKELHGDREAKSARGHFEKTFQNREPEYNISVTSKGNLTDTIEKIAGSRSKAKTLIKDGAVDVDGKTVIDPNFDIRGGERIKIGKRNFVQVK